MQHQEWTLRRCIPIPTYTGARNIGKAFSGADLKSVACADTKRRHQEKREGQPVHVRTCGTSILSGGCSEPLSARKHHAAQPCLHPFMFYRTPGRVPRKVWHGTVCVIFWLFYSATLNTPAHGWPLSQPASCSAGHASQLGYNHNSAYRLSHVPQDCPDSAGVQGASGWYGLGPTFINRVSSMLAR